MNFLGIDTSADYLTVIAQKEEKTQTRYIENCARAHSVILMREIDAVLNALSMHPKDCDFFAVTVGPGSFTGIRIGISTVKGLCLATGKKALSITSFDTLAYAEKDEKLLCIVDAGHSCVYACGYENNQVTVAPHYCTREEAEGYVKEGYRLVDSKHTDSAKGFLEAVKNKCSQLCEADTLAALYLRKSSAEENLK